MPPSLTMPERPVILIPGHTSGLHRCSEFPVEIENCPMEVVQNRVIIVWKDKNMFRDWLRTEQRSGGFLFKLTQEGDSNKLFEFVCHCSSPDPEGCPCKLLFLVSEEKDAPIVGWYHYVHLHLNVENPRRSESISKSPAVSNSSMDCKKFKKEFKVSRKSLEKSKTPSHLSAMTLSPLKKDRCRFPLSHVRGIPYVPKEDTRKNSSTSADSLNSEGEQ